MDMTLLDTRAAVKRTWGELSELTGVCIDLTAVLGRIGIPLEQEMAHWFADADIPGYVETYRSLYARLAIDAATPMPGARSALDAVHAAGGTAVVVTAKNEASAQQHVQYLGLAVDVVVGGLFGVDKAAALREHGATVYVGDHVHDMAGAHAAGASAVGVCTGPCDLTQLTGAGADAILTDLTEFPDWFQGHVLDQRLTALERRLHEIGSVMVAFSGGADSAFLLAAAARFLGPDRVIAATAFSDSLPESEREPGREFCERLGIRQVTPETHEMARAGYRANAGDRCYFCKAELLDVLRPLAEQYGIAAVATGTNADDAVAGFRPGIRAAAERGAVTPLLDAGLRKAQIRAASRRWGLPTWDKPAAACLSSRIAYGIEVSPSRLARVERAEVSVRAALDQHGVAVRDLRVRDLGDRARVELDADALARVGNDAAAESDVLSAVTGAGFPDGYVDPKGFRSGSMNELLAEPSAYR